MRSLDGTEAGLIDGEHADARLNGYRKRACTFISDDVCFFKNPSR